MNFDDLVEKITQANLPVPQQVNLTCLLITQSACNGFLNGNPNPREERIDAFFNANNLKKVWEQCYAPKHKFMAATDNKPVMPTKKDIISFLAMYLDYDVQAAIKRAA